jgi:hypothetical protein
MMIGSAQAEILWKKSRRASLAQSFLSTREARAKAL